jgi:hypothetical protein
VLRFGKWLQYGKSFVAGVLPLLACEACRLPVEPGDELVTDFKFQPEAFDSFTGSASIRYTLDRPAVTTLRVTRKEGETVIILFTSLQESKGSHSHAWQGDTEQGYFAASGGYLGVLEVEGRSYETVVRVYHR